MKDEHKRRQKAERESRKPKPDIDSNVIVEPISLVRLADTGDVVVSVDVQGNDIVALSDFNTRLVAYNLEDDENFETITHDSEI